MFNEDGECHTCNVVGCNKCLRSSEDVCVECIDDDWTYIINGRCDCWWSSWEKPNSKGICDYCYAKGCASCIRGSSYRCYKC